MRNLTKRTPWKDYYNWSFVIFLTSLLGFVMIFSLTQGYEGFTESFYQKKWLIENFNHLRIKIGDKVFPQILIGEDGWLEYTGGGNIDDYQNANLFNPAQLELIGDTIKACNEYAVEQNFIFLIVVAPNKASIYPEKLPPLIKPVSSQSRFDQLNEYLISRNLPEILDLRPALRGARKNQDVYLRADTHWNGYGAYIAYREILKILARDYPQLSAYPESFFRLQEGKPQQSELAKLINASYIFETRVLVKRDIEFVKQMDIQTSFGYHRETYIPDSGLPALLIYHDSFGHRQLNDMLKANFSKANYISISATEQFLTQQTIEYFTPNILVIETVERNLGILQKILSGCAD